MKQVKRTPVKPKAAENNEENMAEVVVYLSLSPLHFVAFCFSINQIKKGFYIFGISTFSCTK